MAESDVQERTEEATPKRRQDARDKGQVPRSRELNTLGILLTGGAALSLSGPFIMERMTAVSRAAFQPQINSLGDADLMFQTFAQASIDTLVSIGPFLALMFLVAALIPMALGGWNFSFDALAFKWERIDPIKGLGRIFSVKGLVELLKALIKFAFLGAIGGAWLWYSAPEYLGLGLAPLGGGMSQGAEFVLVAFLAAVTPMVVIVAIDVPFQLWDYARQLKMSRRELKDEGKETEGSPELKARLRKQQLEVAQRRMMAAVPTADVVINNPTHFSVALRYEEKTAAAPVVVAAGVDLVATRIREVARGHDVIQVSAPLLARALYYNARVGKQIPASLFMAVAQVLAYVYQLRPRTAGNAAAPDLSHIQVPDSLRTE